PTDVARLAQTRPRPAPTLARPRAPPARPSLPTRRSSDLRRAAEDLTCQAAHLPSRERLLELRAALGNLAADETARRQLSEQLSRDRKSTRLNSSHGSISYAVFCLKQTSRGSARGRRRCAR